MLPRFFDEYLLALHGLRLLARKKFFWFIFLPLFFFFGTLLNLLATGLSSLRLLFSGDFSLAGSVLSSAFLGLFGYKRTFLDWLPVFLLALLQAMLITFLIFLARKNHRQLTRNSSSMEASALVAGLALLGSGCPTCGTTLLAPLLGTLLSGASGSLALAGTISVILNIFAILLGFIVFRKLGLIVYATIKSEHHLNKRKAKP